MYIKVIFSVMCLLPLFVFPQEKCDYTLDFRKQLVFESGDLLYSKLDNSDVISGVLKDDVYFYVKYWGCRHIGMNATLFVPDGEIDNDSASKKIAWFFGKVLDSDDFLKVKEHISPLILTGGGEKYIESIKYDEFKVEAIRKDGFYVFSVIFYKS